MVIERGLYEFEELNEFLIYIFTSNVEALFRKRSVSFQYDDKEYAMSIVSKKDKYLIDIS